MYRLDVPKVALAMYQKLGYDSLDLSAVPGTLFKLDQPPSVEPVKVPTEKSKRAKKPKPPTAPKRSIKAPPPAPKPVVVPEPSPSTSTESGFSPILNDAVNLPDRLPAATKVYNEHAGKPYKPPYSYASLIGQVRETSAIDIIEG